MFPNLDVRHLHAVIVLAEERNFTRAADRLHITSLRSANRLPTSKKSIDFTCSLAIRDGLSNSRMRACLRPRGSLAVLHTERAVHFAQGAHEGSDSILTVGHSPYADHAWIAAMLAIRLPLYPTLRIRLMTQFAMESSGASL